MVISHVYNIRTSYPVRLRGDNEVSLSFPKVCIVCNAAVVTRSDREAQYPHADQRPHIVFQ